MQKRQAKDETDKQKIWVVNWAVGQDIGQSLGSKSRKLISEKFGRYFYRPEALPRRPFTVKDWFSVHCKEYTIRVYVLYTTCILRANSQ